jgi:hypothetical protein
LTHEQAAELLLDLPVGRLGESVPADLRGHVATCEKCKSALGIRDMLAEGLRHEGRAAAGDHIAADEVVAFALQKERLPTTDLARIAAHARSCPSCAGEVETVRRAEEAAAPPSPGPIWRLLDSLARAGRPQLAAAAAALVFAVLGYPAYLGMYELPRLSGQVDSLRQERVRLEADSAARLGALRSELDWELEAARAASRDRGPVEVHFLEPPTRRGESAAILRVSSDQPAVYIAVPLDPDLVSPAGSYTFAITSAAGFVRAWQVAGADVGRYVESPQGAVVFSLPSAELVPGAYTLKVSTRSGPKEEIVLEVSFEIAG